MPQESHTGACSLVHSLAYNWKDPLLKLEEVLGPLAVLVSGSAVQG